MSYYIDNVQPYLDAIGDDKSFINATRPELNYGILNYLIITPDTFPMINEDDSEEVKLNKILRRNCRGLKYRLSDGKILALPHWKFFNIGEKLETQVSNIDTSSGITIINKLDGSMVHPIIIDDTTEEMLWMTKMGINDISKKVQKHVEDFCPNHIRLSKDLIKKNMTPCFEICSPSLKIVVHYERTSLVLTEIRNNFTGEPVSVEDLLRIGKEYDVPTVEIMKVDGANLSEILENIYSMEGIEGAILRIENQKYKVKTEWYRSRHRAISNLMTEKNVLGFILNEEIDDVVSYLDEGPDKDNIIRYANDISASILNVIAKSQKLAIELKDLSRKEQNDYCDNNNIFYKMLVMHALRNEGLGPEELRFVLFGKFKNFFVRQYTNSNRLEDNRMWIGNIKYYDYMSGFFFSMSDN